MKTLPDYVISFMKVFKTKGFQIYLVGGAVRDLVLNKNIDWNLADFATNARPQEIVKFFPKTFYENQFGTVGVEWEDGPTSSFDKLRTSLGASKKIIFEGSLKNAVEGFPQNINVAATLFLASKFNNIKVKIVVDSDAIFNTHEIEAAGDFGIITSTAINLPSKNPKTSYLALLSAIQTIKNIRNNVKIGG